MNSIVKSHKKSQQEQQAQQLKSNYKKKLSNFGSELKEIEDEEEALIQQSIRKNIYLEQIQIDQCISKNKKSEYYSPPVNVLLHRPLYSCITSNLSSQISPDVINQQQLPQDEKYLSVKPYEPIPYNQNQMPFYDPDISFSQECINRMQYLKKLDRFLNQFQRDLQYMKQSKNTRQNPKQKQLEDLKALSKLDQSLDFHCQLYRQNNLQKYKQLLKVTQSVNKKKEQMIVSRDQLLEQQRIGQVLQKQYKKEKGQLQQAQRQVNILKDKVIAEKFQIAIIKLQYSRGLYRYGVSTTTENLSQHYLLDPSYSKWDTKAKNIDENDLNMFVFSSLYPMITNIFNDFSFQSNIYKLMFNLMNNISESDKKQNFNMLKNRIKKYYTSKKFVSLQACLKQNVKQRKRKIILICSKTKLQQIQAKILDSIKKYHNPLIGVFNGQIQEQQLIEDTPFHVKRLLIEYYYENLKTSVTFDITYCPVDQLTIAGIDFLRKRTTKNQPVLFWLQVPLVVLNERKAELLQIHNLLRKSRCFSKILEQNGGFKKALTKQNT